jgi:hypothetical protein
MVLVFAIGGAIGVLFTMALSSLVNEAKTYEQIRAANADRDPFGPDGHLVDL